MLSSNFLYTFCCLGICNTRFLDFISEIRQTVDILHDNQSNSYCMQLHFAICRCIFLRTYNSALVISQTKHQKERPSNHLTGMKTEIFASPSLSIQLFVIFCCSVACFVGWEVILPIYGDIVVVHFFSQLLWTLQSSQEATVLFIFNKYVSFFRTKHKTILQKSTRRYVKGRQFAVIRNIETSNISHQC